MDDNTEKKVGIVIVNYITSITTINYINNSLLNQEGVEVVIVIIDNASPNGCFRDLEQAFKNIPQVKLIKNIENRGYGTGCNAGIRFLEEFDCDYIIISNNDIVLEDKDLINKMAHRYSDLKDPGFASPVMFVNNKVNLEYTAWKLPVKTSEILGSTFLLKYLFRSYLKKSYYSIDFKSMTPIKVDCLAGSFFMGSPAIFKQLDYFDEKVFLYYEESILGTKVKKAGLNNYLLQDCRYDHLHSHTINTVFSFKEKFRKNFESKIYYWKKYQGAGSSFIFLLKMLFLIFRFELLVVSVIRNRIPAKANEQ
jgi:N-acetylglucosaminyl-diphospho-decaprenol L-rhamnosyltransferase